MSFIKVKQTNGQRADIRATSVVGIVEFKDGTVIRLDDGSSVEVREGFQAVRNALANAEAE